MGAVHPEAAAEGTTYWRRWRTTRMRPGCDGRNRRSRRSRPWIREILGEEPVRGVLATVETETKYSGYIQQQERQMERLKNSERRPIPAEFEFRAFPAFLVRCSRSWSASGPETLGPSGANSRCDPGCGRDFGLLSESGPCLSEYPCSQSAPRAAPALEQDAEPDPNRFHWSGITASRCSWAGICLPGRCGSAISVRPGFPGFPVAILRPDCQVTLIESHQRKAVFLKEASRGIPNIRVLAKRAEDVQGAFRLGDFPGGQCGRSCVRFSTGSRRTMRC